MKKCSVFESAHILGRKWNIALIEQIESGGQQGFNFLLQRMKNISPKVLSQNLQEMEESKIIAKKTKAASLERTSYSLTPKGMELYSIIKSMKEWNARHGATACQGKKCTECSYYC